MSRYSSLPAGVAVAALLFGAGARPAASEVLQLDPAILACVLDPGCQPGPQLQIAIDPDFAFLGVETFRVIGRGKLLDVAGLQLQIPTSVFLARDEEHETYKGVWQPLGSSGRKFLLVLDAASRDVLEAKISAGCSAAVGQPLGAALLGTPRVVLRTNADGSEAQLEVKAKGTAGGFAFRYRATLAGGATSLPAPLP